MASTEDPQPEDKAITRRDFVKILAVVGFASTLAGAASSLRFFGFITPPTEAGTETTAQLAWPRIKITNVSSLEPLTALKFNYPLINTPNFLVKMGTPSENGVGPDGDIVAFSMICQHLGYYLGFQPAGTSPPCRSGYKTPVAEGFCCAHGGEYDFARGAAVIGGPPPRPVPRVQLEFDNATGEIYAVAMTGPTIFSHGTAGVTDPASVLKSDLEGGEVVTQDTVFLGLG